MNRKTLLTMAVLASLTAASVSAATPTPAAGKSAARAQIDRNGDGVIDRDEAKAHPRLAAKFDALDKNKDGKLDASERPRHAGKRHGGRHGHGARGGFADAALDIDKDGRISRAEAAASERFAARFDQLDVNRDGFIDKADREQHAKARRDTWFAAADADRDGKLTRAEIDAADATRRAEFQQRMQARGAERFAALDTDKDGRISRDEAKAAGRLADRFDALDANKDGYLGKDELQPRKPSMR